MKFEKIKGQQNRYLGRPIGKDGKPRDVIWVLFSRAGRGRLEESLRTPILGEARDKRDQRIADFLGEKVRLKSAVFLVEEKFEQFLDLKKGKAPATYESMKNQWTVHLKAFFGGMILDEVTETTWLEYVNKKRETHPDRKFFNDRKYLSMFLHWLHRGGFIHKIHKLPDVDPEIAAGRVYGDDEIKKLLDNADGTLKLQILCAVTMGMRVGEVMSLEWNQIDFQAKTIYLPAHKTKIRKERTFGISEACLQMFLDLRTESLGTAVFPSPADPNVTQGRDGHKRAWISCKVSAGLPRNFRFHWLRHTFLTKAFKKSVNPALICHYAGLSLDEAQATYLHFTPEDTRIVSSLVNP